MYSLAKFAAKFPATIESVILLPATNSPFDVPPAVEPSSCESAFVIGESMNSDKIKAHIDRTAEEAKEAVDLLSEKIDRATACSHEQMDRMKNRVRQGVLDAVDKTEEKTIEVADKIRRKVSR